MTPQQQLVQAIEQNNTKNLTKAILEGADVNQKCSFQNEHVIRMVNAYTENALHPLEMACFLGNLDVLNALIENGATPQSGRPVYYASLLHNNGNGTLSDFSVNLLQHIIKAGADVNADYGAALHYFAMNHECKMMEILLNNAADPNLINPKNGITPLMELFYEDCDTDKIYPCVSLLLKAGADVYLKDNEGLSILDYMSKARIWEAGEYTTEMIRELIEVPYHQKELDAIAGVSSEKELNIL